MGSLHTFYFKRHSSNVLTTWLIIKNLFKKLKMPAEAAESQRLVMVSSGAGINCRTFVFKNEGHTLGNVLRSVIMQNPQVAFCGYSLPHPAEGQMHLRIQTVEGVDAQDALLKGLTDLKKMTVHAKEVFQTAVDTQQ